MTLWLYWSFPCISPGPIFGNGRFWDLNSKPNIRPGVYSESSIIECILAIVVRHFLRNLARSHVQSDTLNTPIAQTSYVFQFSKYEAWKTRYTLKTWHVFTFTIDIVGSKSDAKSTPWAYFWASFPNIGALGLYSGGLIYGKLPWMAA